MCATIKLSICPPQNSYTSQIPVYLRVVFVVVFRLLSPVRLFATAWIAASQAPLSFTISQSLCKLMSTVDDAIQPSHPLLLLSSAFPSKESFPVCLLFASSGQSIGASASATVLPMSIQG